MLAGSALVIGFFLAALVALMGQFRAEFESVGLWTLFRESWFCPIFAFTLNTAAYTRQIIRGGLQDVPTGQIEAARVVGMSG